MSQISQVRDSSNWRTEAYIETKDDICYNING